MRYLRSNTAVRVTVGPFFDKTDGITPKTALTVTNCKLTLMVDDGNVPTLVLDTNPTASGGSNDMIHVSGDDAGFYDLELAAANVNYLGRAMLALTDATNHCPVFHEFMILPAMVYDSLVLGTDDLDTNTKKWNDLTTVALPLVPATAGRTLVVDAAGLADANVVKLGPTGSGTAQTARDVGTSVLVGDKTGFALTAGEHTNIASDAQTGLTAQGYTTTRAGYLDTLNGLVSAIWAAIVDSAGVTTLLSRLSALRAGYLDWLNIGGLVASQSEVTAIQNNTRVVRVVPDVLERPDSGTFVFRLEILLYDDAGNMEAPDSAPSIAVVNQAGTSRDANLDSTTMSLVSTGRYRSTYSMDNAHALEQLMFSFSVVEGGATRLYGNTGQVVDTTAIDFTSADRTKLDTIHSKLPSGTISDFNEAANAVNLAPDQSGVTIGTINALGSQAKAEVNAELDSALDTAVPSSPTANSINERVKTLDDNYTATRAAKIDNLDAAISTRSSHAAADVWAVSVRTLSGFGTLVTDIVTAVWTAASRTLSTFGFTVNTNANATETATKAIADKLDTAMEADGPVHRFTANALEQAPAGGGGGGADWSAGEREQIRQALGVTGTKAATSGGNLDHVEAKTNTIGSGVVTSVSPVSPDGESIQIVRGDDYFAADGRSFDWMNDTWPDLTSAIILLTIRNPQKFVRVSGSVITPTGTAHVRVEIPKASTRLLQVDTEGIRFDVEAQLASGHVTTLVTGMATVVEA